MNNSTSKSNICHARCITRWVIISAIFSVFSYGNSLSVQYKSKSEGDVSPDSSFPSYKIQLNGVEHRVRDTGDPHKGSNNNPSSEAMLKQKHSDALPPIAVLMHGLAGSADSWEDVAPLLYNDGIRCIAIDRVGFGMTERPKRPALPGLPRLPFSGEVASMLDDILESKGSGNANGQRRNDLLPDPRKVISTALRRPETIFPPLPWQFPISNRLSKDDLDMNAKKDPYSSDFAIEAIWPLLELTNSTPPKTRITKKRQVYFVGHSAGGPLALRALRDAEEKKTTTLPVGMESAGAILVAPAVLDPTEDPDVYEIAQDKEGKESAPFTVSLDQLPQSIRIAIFRGVLSLPDAFGLQLARNIYDGRNLTEAILGQISPSISMEKERLAYLVHKYTRPVKENPEDWDVGLLNVYRSLFGKPSGNGEQIHQTKKNRGRSLLQSVKIARNRVQVISGADDVVVPPQASRKVANLLKGKNIEVDYTEIAGTGHLPMDERPEELAVIIFKFINSKR